MNSDHQVKLWTGFEDGQRREVLLCASPQKTFYFRLRNEDQISEIAVKPSELHRILAGETGLFFENSTCSVSIHVEQGEATFSFVGTCLVSFPIQLNKLGLLLRSIGLDAPH